MHVCNKVFQIIHILVIFALIMITFHCSVSGKVMSLNRAPLQGVTVQVRLAFLNILFITV